MRSDVIPFDTNRFRPMSAQALDDVREMESLARQLPQVPMHTNHTVHAGLYARTIIIPEGVVLTGAMIKIPTLLILSGEAIVYVGENDPLHIVGNQQIIPASAARKQAFYAIKETTLTMLFADKRQTRPIDIMENIYELEEQFTDEADALMSRHEPNTNYITITGE